MVFLCCEITAAITGATNIPMVANFHEKNSQQIKVGRISVVGPGKNVGIPKLVNQLIPEERP